MILMPVSSLSLSLSCPVFHCFLVFVRVRVCVFIDELDFAAYGLWSYGN